MLETSPPPTGPVAPRAPHPVDGYLFVVTYGRSGSTLLSNVLNAIPGVVIRGENLHAIHDLRRIVEKTEAYPWFIRHLEAGRQTIPDDPWYGAELVDPDRVARAFGDAFVTTVMNLPPETRIGGFKEIRYLERPGEIAADLDFLRRTFPHPRFLFLTRDHGSVMRSGWFVQKSRLVVRRQLRAADAAFADYAARHPEICCSVAYESFVANPEGLRPVFDFLGAPFDQAAVAAVLDRRLGHLSGHARSPRDRLIINPVKRSLHLVQTFLGGTSSRR